MSSGVCSSKKKKLKKMHAPKKSKTAKIEILKMPQDFDYPFFEFSHLDINISSGCAS